MSTLAPHRPFGVSLLSIWLYIAGFLNVVAGVITLFSTGDDELLREMKTTSGELTTYGIVAIIVGIITIIVGHLLRTRSNFARVLVALLALIQLGMTIWAVATIGAVHWYNAIAPLVVYAAVCGYLFFDRDAKEYFAT
jgi:hypothetical protein